MELKKKALGVNKTRLSNTHSTRNKTNTKTKMKRSLLIIKGIIDYLKSDSYFYSPLFDPSLMHINSSAGREAGEPLLKNEGNLREKMVEYLKSDTYLYAPLGDTKPSEHFTKKNLISPPEGHEEQLKKAINNVSSRETSSQKMRATEDSLQTKQVAEDSIGQKQGDHISKGAAGDGIVVTPSTPELLEVKTRVIRRSYHTRLSTISGLTSPCPELLCAVTHKKPVISQ